MEISVLLDRCGQGDPLAWEALVRRFQGRVYGLAVQYLGDREEARDAAQEVFVKVYRSLDGTVRAETFLSWLLRVTRNACIDRIRRRNARPTAAAVPLEEMGTLRSEAPSPADQLRQSDLRRAVHAALDRLSPVNREILILKDIQGLRLEEIAEMLDIPVGTAKSRSNRARIELARALAGHEAVLGREGGTP